MRTQAEIEHQFTHHAPATPRKVDLHKTLSALYLEFALRLGETLPATPERTQCLRQLQESRASAHLTVAVLPDE